MYSVKCIYIQFLSILNLLKCIVVYQKEFFIVNSVLHCKVFIIHKCLKNEYEVFFVECDTRMSVLLTVSPHVSYLDSTMIVTLFPPQV